MQACGSAQPSLHRAHELLGVSAHADAAEVARAYRRQARRLHPDISVEPNATEQFWALQAAYRVAVGAAHSDGAQVPIQVVHHDPVVVLGVPAGGGLPAATAGQQGGVAWLAAGPVLVRRPPRRPDPGEEPRTEPGLTAMSSGGGP